MLVSIVICTHRKERYSDLMEAIDSLNVQSYNNLEIVVVVDGNKELYNEIAKGGIEVDKLKLILNEANLGLSGSRNRGIKESKGDIIAFFDDDAVADKNWLEELVRMYEEHDAIVYHKVFPERLSR